MKCLQLHLMSQSTPISSRNTFSLEEHISQKAAKGDTVRKSAHVQHGIHHFFTDPVISNHHNALNNGLAAAGFTFLNTLDGFAPRNVEGSVSSQQQELLEENATLKTQLSQLQQKVSKLERQSQQFVKVSFKKQPSSDQGGSMEDLRSNLQHRDQQVIGLCLMLERKTSQMKQLRDELTNSHTSTQQNYRTISNLEEMIRLGQQRIKDLERRCLDSSHKIDDLKKEIQRCQKELSKKNAEYEQAKEIGQQQINYLVGLLEQKQGHRPTLHRSAVHRQSQQVSFSQPEPQNQQYLSRFHKFCETIDKKLGQSIQKDKPTTRSRAHTQRSSQQHYQQTINRILSQSTQVKRQLDQLASRITHDY